MPEKGNSNPSVSQQPQRKRKSHQKSRTGCVICRLRRVKCGEEKPVCRQCEASYISCNYGYGKSVLHNENDQILSCYENSLTLEQPFSLKDNIDHSIIRRFRSRTAQTFGVPETVHLYVEVVPRLAIEHEFLLHTVYVITLVHDRTLISSSLPSESEQRHFGKGVNLFNQRLSTGQFASDWDALWTTAVYLCAIATSSIQSDNSDQAWSGSTTRSPSFDWLRLQQGLRMMWKAADFENMFSVFQPAEMDSKFNCAAPDVPGQGVMGVPPLLRELCNLSENSTSTNNPYHVAVHHLSTLLAIPSTPANTLKFLIFAGGMTPDFQGLLSAKDPRALLIMALWYSKVFYCQWWISLRARVECRAIFDYLSQRRIDDQYFKQALDILRVVQNTADSEIARTLLYDTHPRPRSKYNEEGPTSRRVDMFWDSLL